MKFIEGIKYTTKRVVDGIKSLDTYVKVFLIVFGILLALGLLKTFGIFSITL